MIRPRNSCASAVTGAEGGPAHVVVAAVGDRHPQLCTSDAEPRRQFFGQKQLPVDMRDLWLPDRRTGRRGEIAPVATKRRRRSHRPPREAFAHYSGVVETDADSRSWSVRRAAFNGAVRVMAMAWTADKNDHADREVVVRDAVVISRPPALPGAFGDRSAKTPLRPRQRRRSDRRLQGRSWTTRLADRRSTLSTKVKLAGRARRLHRAGDGSRSRPGFKSRSASPARHRRHPDIIAGQPPTRVYRRQREAARRRRRSRSRRP